MGVKNFKRMSKKRFKTSKYLKKLKKNFFRKTLLPAKPEYPENRGTSETLRNMKSLQVHVKKSHF